MLLKRAVIARLVAVCLLALALAACAATATPAAQADPTPPGPVTGAVTLVLWHGWSSGDLQALSRLVERFNRQHPDGRVSLQSVPLATFDGDLRAAINAGAGPHIVLIPNTWIGSLAAGEMLLPLDELVAAADRQPLIPAALGGAQVRGRDGKTHLYGLPVSFDTLALFYDRRNFLTPPADTAELIRTAHGVGDPSAPRWGLALNLSLENMIGYLYAAGGRVFDDGGQVVLGGAGRAGAERWLAWLAQLKDDGQVLARADSSMQIDGELKAGHALMTFDWAHQLAFYRSLWGENLGVAPLPRMSATNQPPQPYVRSEVLAINSRASAAERQAALAFLRFMTGPDAQAELLKSDIQPARGDLKLDGLGLDAAQVMAAQAFRSQAQAGQPMPNTPAREIVRRELALMQQQVLRGEAAPADAVTEADQRLRQQIPTPGQ